MTKLHDEVLCYVEMRVASSELKAAWIDYGLLGPLNREKFAAHLESAQTKDDELMERVFKPAIHCLLRGAKMPEMLGECGESAVLRITLERPAVSI